MGIPFRIRGNPFGSKVHVKMSSPVVFLLLLVSMTVTAKQAVPAYKINLDLPEEERWYEVTANYKGLSGMLKSIIRQFVPQSIFPLVEKIGESIDDYLPKPFAGELKGLAKAINGSWGDAVLLNLIYDITAHCTSIISQDAKGRIWHSRNLDYDFTEILRNVTINVEFLRKGKVVYSGTTFAGYVGLLTGQKPHSFTVSVDERYEHSSRWENAVAAILDKSATLISFSVRRTLEEDVSFTEAVVNLAIRDTIAPVYFILGGVYPGQGAIISRDRLRAVDTWFLDPTNGRWFIVETNYDHWKPAPKSDDRRDAAIKMMESLGQGNIDSYHLFKVMSTNPVGRGTTVYTTIMSAAQPNLYSTWLWPLNSTASSPEQNQYLQLPTHKRQQRFRPIHMNHQFKDRL